MNEEQHRISLMARNLLATLDALVPNSTAHYAVEGARRAVKVLANTADTIETAQPKEWTFFGHWEGNKIVIDYSHPGTVNDDRQDDAGLYEEGLWAASGGGATIEEAEANAKAEYENEEDEGGHQEYESEDVVHLFVADRHFRRIDATHIVGSGELLKVKEGQRVVVSDDLEHTYIVEGVAVESLAGEQEAHVVLRRARRIVDAAYVQRLLDEKVAAESVSEGA